MRIPRSLSLARRMRDARLRRLHRIGRVLSGSLVEFPGHSSRYLTDKLEGRTRTLYIPLSWLREVKTWNRNYKEARRLLRELSELERAILRHEIKRKSLP